MYFIRFEDILTDQRKTVEGTFEYLLAIESTKGRYLEKRLDQTIGELSDAGLYKPRAAKMEASSNMKYFS